MISLENKTEVKDHLSYRGYEIDLYFDVSSGNYYVTWNDAKFPLLNYDNEGFYELKLLIDDTLDVIKRYSNFKCTKLEWFRNGDFRDIRLIKNFRTIKIYLVESSVANLKAIIDDADKIINQ